MSPPTLRIGHSPDADDAFMFYALASGRVAPHGVALVHVIEDIESLNRRAAAGELEITAVSFAAFPFVADRYALMDCGASVGDGYGPVVVARTALSRAALLSGTVAIPGERTTAALALRLWLPGARTMSVPFDQVGEAVLAGRADAGVLIHEGQLTYGQQGLVKIADLGEAWKRRHDLPLPLGGNVVRRDVPPRAAAAVAEALRASVRYALDHRDEALAHALRFARGLPRDQADRFVGLYVNDYTLDLGPAGRAGLRTLFAEGERAGLLPHGATRLLEPTERRAPAS